MSWSLLSNFLVATLAITNPLGKIPIWCQLTRGLEPRVRRWLALLITATVLVLLLAALLFGKQVLSLFGIDLAAFRLAGGVIVLLLGIQMLRGEIGLDGAGEEEGDAESALGQAKARYRDIMVPFAMPILAGPGALSTMIIYASRSSDWATLGAMSGVIVLVCAALLVMLLLALPIQRWVGATVLELITRLFGLLLAAIAMQFIVTALGEIFPAWIEHASPIQDDVTTQPTTQTARHAGAG